MPSQTLIFSELERSRLEIPSVRLATQLNGLLEISGEETCLRLATPIGKMPRGAKREKQGSENRRRHQGEKQQFKKGNKDCRAEEQREKESCGTHDVSTF